MNKTAHIFDMKTRVSLCWEMTKYVKGEWTTPGVEHRCSYGTTDDSELCEECKRLVRHRFCWIKRTFQELGTDE